MLDQRIRRGRRPRRPFYPRLVNSQQNVNMIWHNHIFLNLDTWNAVSREDISFCSFSVSRQSGIRGVEGAAPYDLT